MATAVSTQLSALTGSNTVQQMMSDVNSLKTLSALATDAAGSGDFVPTTGGTFTGQITVNKSGFSSVTISNDSTSESQLRFDTSTAARISNQSETALIFDTNASERLRIDSAGNVDIGSQSAINGGRYLDITNTNGVATDFSILRLITQEVGSSSTTSADLFKRKNGQLTLSNNDTDSAAHLTLQVGASERMRIDSSGNVGIGVTSPSQKLEVLGSAMLKGVSTEARFLEIGTGRTGNGTSYIDLIGDGTYTDYGARFIRAHTGPNATTAIQHRGTGNLTLLTEEAAAITLRTTNTERMRIESGGRVGIGTSAPSSLLHVTKGGTNQGLATFEANLGTNNGRALTLKSPNTDSSSDPFVWGTGNSIGWQIDGSDAMLIDATGDITFYRGVVNLQSTSGNPAQMNFYCESGNAHYTRIQSSPHASYSGNVVLTLPTTSGTLATTASVATTGKSIAMAIVFG